MHAVAQHVFQLPHIARPVVPRQHHLRALRKPANIFMELRGELLDEMPGQQRQVFLALRQRRHRTSTMESR